MMRNGFSKEREEDTNLKGQMMSLIDEIFFRHVENS